LYAASLVSYTWFLYANKKLVGWAGTLCLGSGIAVHWQLLLERGREVHAVPYQDLYGSMSLLAWFLAVTYLGLEVYHRQRSVGPFVLPFVILLMLGAMLVEPKTPPPAPSRGAVFAFHVTMEILAYAAFALSFVLSVIYLIQNRVLRERHLGATFWRFPALEVLERMSRSSVVVGVVALLIGMCLGLFQATRLWEGGLSLDPKVVVSVLILLIYVGYLWLGRTTAWRGARASLLCILNFLVVIFSYTVVNVYLSPHHRYF